MSDNSGDGGNIGAPDLEAEIGLALELIAVASETVQTVFTNGTDDVEVETAEVLGSLLAQISDSDRLWSAAHDALDEEDGFTAEEVQEHLDSDAFAEEERHALAAISDDITASQTLLSLDTDQLPSADPHEVIEEAQQAVGDIADECNETAGKPPEARSRWKIVRLARKGLIVGGASLAIAGDIVSPDVTGITKVGSIMAGSGTILSQVRLPGD